MSVSHSTLREADLLEASRLISADSKAIILHGEKLETDFYYSLIILTHLFKICSNTHTHISDALYCLFSRSVYSRAVFDYCYEASE